MPNLMQNPGSMRPAPGGASAYRAKPPVAKLPEGNAAQPDMSGPRAALSQYVGQSPNALAALMRQRFGGGGGTAGAAMAKPAHLDPPGGGPRASLSTFLTGGGAPVRGGVNGGGMGIRPPGPVRMGGMYR